MSDVGDADKHGRVKLTKEEIRKQLARRTLANRDLLYFTTLTHPNYMPGWVHKDIAKRLMRFSRQVAEGNSPRLMLLMPPRHGKSELASIRFPAWHLGHNPTHEVINVGYNLDLPMKFSRKVREVVESVDYSNIFPDVSVNPNIRSAESWQLLTGGSFTAAGVGGGVTGKGCHVLIVDDPLKNMEEADSAGIREKLEDWYQSTAYTRLAPGGGVLLIQTCWHDDDLAGRLLEAARRDPEADQFEVVRYPALAEKFEYRHSETLEAMSMEDYVPPDELGQGWVFIRAPGEPLHEARYPASALKRIKATLTPRIWSALYQQSPVPDEGMYFRAEYFVHQQVMPDPQGLNFFFAWDFAIGEKQTNDYTVGTAIGQDQFGLFYVFEVCRFRGDSFTIVQHILDMYKRWLPYAADTVTGFEDGQIFKAIEPLLKKAMNETNSYFPYELLKPLSDKSVRARVLQGLMQQHRIVFPAEADWLSTAKQELLRFPAGAHDDIVDSLAWNARLSVDKTPPNEVRTVPIKSWRDKIRVSSTAQNSHMVA